MTNKQRLFEYLSSYDLLFLSTAQKEPTGCVVYYGIDTDFSLYILTPPMTEHAENIFATGKVAGVVTDTNQQLFETQYKIGAQIKGIADQVYAKEEIKKGLLIWARKRKDAANDIFTSIENGTRKSRLFKIRPAEIKWFNEEIYGPEGTEVFTF